MCGGWLGLAGIGVWQGWLGQKGEYVVEQVGMRWGDMWLDRLG